MQQIPTPVPQAVLERLEPSSLVQAYRAGDDSAAELLIARYARYLHKWLRLLTTGKWDRRDPEVRHFLSMLSGSDPEFAAHALRQRMKLYEREDLLQELKLILIEGALRHYHPTAQFRFLLKRRVIQLTRDPLVFDQTRRVPLEGSLAASEKPADIDEAWVQGITCGPGFDQLTERDRRVIQLLYWYGWTQERVAGHLEVHVSTVERTVRRIRRTLGRMR